MTAYWDDLFAKVQEWINNNVPQNERPELPELYDPNTQDPMEKETWTKIYFAFKGIEYILEKHDIAPL